MIAFDQKYTSNGKERSQRVTGLTSLGCARRLSKLRITLNLPNSDFTSCSRDVKLLGYNYTANVNKATPIRKPKKLSLSKVINGSLALFDILKGDLASDSEIIERANVCANCPLISNTSDNCVGCSANKLAKYARNLAVKYGRNFIEPKIIATKLRPPKTARISEFYCSFCGCSCLNLVLSKGKHFLSKENEQRPSNCWVHKL